MINIQSSEFTTDFNRENFVAQVLEFGAFDGDANGDNGEEYLLPEAKALGFDCNLTYWANKAFDESDRIYSALIKFIESFAKSWVNYCDDYGYEIIYLSNGNLLLSFVTYSKH